ncbi:MAG: DUF4230 domain-containing protein [Bulleidia sp.]|nr:DUF4230 domain-containing protein [Bulleidia sp.]
MMDSKEKRELEDIVEKASEKGAKNAGWKSSIITIVLIAVILCLGAYKLDVFKDNNTGVEQVEGHDVTLDNNGIFGFKAVDFQDAVLGKSQQETKLIVEEQEASVPATITNTGFLNLNITTKTQNVTIYGTGEYTIDLSKITADDVTLNEDTYTVTIAVPYPELNNVIFNSDKTVIGDTERGWLAFGDIKMTAEETQQFELEAQQKLTDALSEQACYDEAVRFAKLSAYEVYQPVISAVSPAYKVTITVKAA